MRVGGSSLEVMEGTPLLAEDFVPVGKRGSADKKGMLAAGRGRTNAVLTLA